MKFLLFMTNNGKYISVRADHIISILPMGDDCTLIELTSGNKIDVTASAESITEMIGATMCDLTGEVE